MQSDNPVIVELKLAARENSLPTHFLKRIVDARQMYLHEGPYQTVEVCYSKTA